MAFAIILLTPDDVGALSTSSDKLLPRARQNVVFELGYFIGKLGRNRVCVLHAEQIELPSDFWGCTYLSIRAAPGNDPWPKKSKWLGLMLI